MINGKKCRFPIVQTNHDTFYLNYTKTFTKLYDALDTWLVENYECNELDYKQILDSMMKDTSMSQVLNNSSLSPLHKFRAKTEKSSDKLFTDKNPGSISDRQRNSTPEPLNFQNLVNRNVLTDLSPKFKQLNDDFSQDNLDDQITEEEHKFSRQINPMITHTTNDFFDLDFADISRNINDVSRFTEIDKNLT